MHPSLTNLYFSFTCLAICSNSSASAASLKNYYNLLWNSITVVHEQKMQLCPTELTKSYTVGSWSFQWKFILRAYWGWGQHLKAKLIRLDVDQLSQSKLVWEAFTNLGLGSIDLVARKWSKAMKHRWTWRGLSNFAKSTNRQLGDLSCSSRGSCKQTKKDKQKWCLKNSLSEINLFQCVAFNILCTIWMKCGWISGGMPPTTQELKCVSLTVCQLHCDSAMVWLKWLNGFNSWYLINAEGNYIYNCGQIVIHILHFEMHMLHSNDCG